MLNRRWSRVAVAAALAFSTIAAGPAGAAAEKAEAPEPPALDELVFDPIQVTVTTKTSASPNADSRQVCKEIHAWVTARSTLLRLIVYRYHHQVGWCYDGDTITEIEEDRDWVTHVDSTYEWKGTSDEAARYYRWGGDSRGRYRSYMQGWLRQCILEVCLNYYPWITINVYADGDSDYDGSAG